MSNSNDQYTNILQKIDQDLKVNTTSKNIQIKTNSDFKIGQTSNFNVGGDAVHRIGKDISTNVGKNINMLIKKDYTKQVGQESNYLINKDQKKTIEKGVIKLKDLQFDLSRKLSIFIQEKFLYHRSGTTNCTYNGVDKKEFEGKIYRSYHNNVIVQKNGDLNHQLIGNTTYSATGDSKIYHSGKYNIQSKGNININRYGNFTYVINNGIFTINGSMLLSNLQLTGEDDGLLYNIVLKGNQLVAELAS